MNFGAVMLAGGKSPRMGCDKAWLEVGGQPMPARQIQLAREIGASEIFISGRAGGDYSEFDCPVLHDKHIEAGPLAGIERALDATTSPLVPVLAVDPPEMNARFLHGLMAGCLGKIGTIPRVSGNIGPLAAFYPKSSQPLAETLLRNGRNAAAFFAGCCVQSGVARFVELAVSEAKYFTNWNSAADLSSAATNSYFWT
jgi:molybdopterin-guanine dinucleotide biosynthesis protein A